MEGHIKLCLSIDRTFQAESCTRHSSDGMCVCYVSTRGNTEASFYLHYCFLFLGLCLESLWRVYKGISSQHKHSRCAWVRHMLLTVVKQLRFWGKSQRGLDDDILETGAERVSLCWVLHAHYLHSPFLSRRKRDGLFPSPSSSIILIWLFTGVSWTPGKKQDKKYL